MQNDEFITWLKGFVDGIDAEHKQVLGFSKSITISTDTWNKLKEKLDETNQPITRSSQVTWTPTPVWFPNTSTTDLSHHTNFTVTNTGKNLLTEDDKII